MTMTEKPEKVLVDRGYTAEIYQQRESSLFRVHYFDPGGRLLGTEEKRANTAEALEYGSVKFKLHKLADTGTTGT